MRHDSKRLQLRHSAVWQSRFVRTPILFVLTIAVLFAAGCRPPILPETEKVWNQNLKESQIWLIPASQGFCYFTRISGEFNSDAEMVHVGLAPNPADNTAWWEVDGASRAKNVTATVRCSYWTNFDLQQMFPVTPPWLSAAPTYTPQPPTNCCPLGVNDCPKPGPPPCAILPQGYWSAAITDMPLDTENSFCYLSGVHGAFNGSEYADTYEVIPGSPNVYRMRIQATTPNQTLFGSAGCVRYGPAVVPDRHTSVYGWSQGNPTTRQMISGADGVCFLTAMGGKFRGNGEWIEIDHDTNPISGVPQQLSGHSDQINVYAAAACVRYRVP